MTADIGHWTFRVAAILLLDVVYSLKMKIWTTFV